MFAYVNLHGVFHLIEWKKQRRKKLKRLKKGSYSFNISYLVVKLPLFFFVGSCICCLWLLAVVAIEGDMHFMCCIMCVYGQVWNTDDGEDAPINDVHYQHGFMAHEQILTYKQIFIILLPSSSFFSRSHLHVSRTSPSSLYIDWLCCIGSNGQTACPFIVFFLLLIILVTHWNLLSTAYFWHWDMMNKTDKTSQRNERLFGKTKENGSRRWLRWSKAVFDVITETLETVD